MFKYLKQCVKMPLKDGNTLLVDVYCVENAYAIV